MANILLVDDDPLLVRMYQKKFELDGHKIVTASDGSQLFSVLADFKPDVILLDVMMPEMNGINALKKLKATDQHKNIPVIMLTNVGSSEKDSEEALEAGAVAYLVKASYSPKEIVQKVKEIVQGYTKDIPEVKTKIKVEKSAPDESSKHEESEDDEPTVVIEDL